MKIRKLIIVCIGFLQSIFFVSNLIVMKLIKSNNVVKKLKYTKVWKLAINIGGHVHKVKIRTHLEAIRKYLKKYH